MVFKYLTRAISACRLQSTGSGLSILDLFVASHQSSSFMTVPGPFKEPPMQSGKQDNGGKNCRRRTFKGRPVQTLSVSWRLSSAPPCQGFIEYESKQCIWPLSAFGSSFPVSAYYLMMMRLSKAAADNHLLACCLVNASLSCKATNQVARVISKERQWGRMLTERQQFLSSPALGDASVMKIIPLCRLV